MKKQLMLVSVATAALIFAGCGGDKKVEERVTQIQTNAPVADANSAAVTTPAPKTEAAKPQAQKEPEAVKQAPAVVKEKAPVEQPKAKEVAASTASPAEGKQIFASRCAACHGQNGEGKATYPKLAGLSKEEALSRLKGYVDGTYGKAQKMIMVGQAKGLDDAQKAAVSEYIATLK